MTIPSSGLPIHWSLLKRPVPNRRLTPRLTIKFVLGVCPYCNKLSASLPPKWYITPPVSAENPITYPHHLLTRTFKELIAIPCTYAFLLITYSIMKLSSSSSLLFATLAISSSSSSLAAPAGDTAHSEGMSDAAQHSALTARRASTSFPVTLTNRNDIHSG